MTMTLGGVVLSDNDMPESIPLGSTLATSEEVYSDGSRHLQVAGYSYANIQLSGTLRYIDQAGTTPINRMEALQVLQRGGQPVEFLWSGKGVSRRFLVTILDFQPAIVRNEQVDYTLSLFRQIDGALSTAALTSGTPQEAARSAQRTSDRLAAQATPGTAGAIMSVQQAIAAAQGRG